MRKKIYSMLITSAMLLTMAGCAKPAEPVADTETAVISEAQEETVAEETTDTTEYTTEDTVTTDVTEAETEEAVEETKTEEETSEPVEETEETIADTEEQEATVEEAEDNKAEDTEEAKEDTAEADNSAADTSKTEDTKPKSNIPDWFDADFYAANNSDVVAALGSSPETLYNHYVNHGKAEGRKANADDPAERVTADNGGNTNTGTGTEGSGDGAVKYVTNKYGETVPSYDYDFPYECYVVYGEGMDRYMFAPADANYHDTYVATGFQYVDSEVTIQPACRSFGCYNGVFYNRWVPKDNS